MTQLRISPAELIIGNHGIFQEGGFMHELSVVGEVVKIVLANAEKNGARKVLKVNLSIGELRDAVDEWLQRLFNYMTADTIAEGAVLIIERLPIIFRCACGEEFNVSLKHLKNVACPHCGNHNVVLISGREFYIRNIEVQEIISSVRQDMTIGDSALR
jgi:hydrogenase nickel incorporation protein HypA/HybF